MSSRPALNMSLPSFFRRSPSANFSSSFSSHDSFPASQLSSSTSAVRAVLGGTLPSSPPAAPNAYWGLTRTVAASPFFIFITMSSRPGKGASSHLTVNCTSCVACTSTPSAVCSASRTVTFSSSFGRFHPSPSRTTFFMSPPSCSRSSSSLQSSSSTSNTRVASAGILGGDPALPYAYSGFSVNTAVSPLRMDATPMSHPLITCPLSSTNLNGSPRPRLESNSSPVDSRVPT
mmetsp:Transcript_1992/g.4603  ORF Transcript_1992/g.4603 Transcript_1992/m.4603 type:complete len:232 (-) Transcript_1992:332-1027(-)